MHSWLYAVALALLPVVVGMLLKKLWPKRAKPKILKPEEGVLFGASTHVPEFKFDLVIGNTGSRGCSALNVELTLLGIRCTELACAPPLPEAIPVDGTMRLSIKGNFVQIPFDGGLTEPEGFEVPTRDSNPSVTGVATVAFDNAKRIEETITFKNIVWE